MSSNPSDGKKREPDDVMITFGPSGKVTFDPPVTLEVAVAIKKEIDAAIEMANEVCGRRPGWDDFLRRALGGYREDDGE